MPSKLTPEIMTLVEAAHTKFRNADQLERPAVTNLVALGHPLAEAYLEARAFFDGLSFACEAAGRRFSYAGTYEHSGYEAPALDLSWWPTPELSDCCAFLHPGHVQWSRYADTVAKAGWPESAAPELRPGVWRICTQNEELLQALQSLGDGRSDMKFTPVLDRHKQLLAHSVMVTESVIARPGQSGDALRLHKEIVALLEKHHEGSVLPQRNAESSAEPALAP